jgi:hypothetical protein
MKSLFLITSLLVCDLAVAQIGVGIGVGVTLSAGPLAACTQEPIRGLVNVVNILPAVSGLLACSSFNKKYVTATGRCGALRHARWSALR